ncbi:MAG: hypothetical protein ONA90_05875, partial [candidate division KSB1 bacterium]|nr:hypothetical protein [candidate division KSB1 bacterium]
GFAIGSRQSIAWITRGEIPRVKLNLSGDGGVTWQPIAHGIENTGAFIWTVPNLPQKGYLVRVADAADDNPADTSEHNFFIIAADQSHGALYFDRVDDLAWIPDNPLLSGGPGKSLTAEAWVNLDTVSGHHQILSKFFDANSKDWGLEAEFGKIVVDIDNDGDNWVYITG